MVDGAKIKKKSRNFGHLKGVETIKRIISGSINLRIPIITFYVFSTENWKRPRAEINFLFKLIESYFAKEIKLVIDQGVKINIIGETKKLSKKLQKTLLKVIDLTKKKTKLLSI